MLKGMILQKYPCLRIWFITNRFYHYSKKKDCDSIRQVDFINYLCKIDGATSCNKKMLEGINGCIDKKLIKICWKFPSDSLKEHNGKLQMQIKGDSEDNKYLDLTVKGREQHSVSYLVSLFFGNPYVKSLFGCIIWFLTIFFSLQFIIK